MLQLLTLESMVVLYAAVHKLLCAWWLSLALHGRQTAEM